MPIQGDLHAACAIWMAACEGDTEAALAALARGAPRLPDPDRPNALGTWETLPYVVETLALLGRREELASLRPRTEAAVRTGAMAIAMHLPRIGAGITAAAECDWPAAQEHFDVALEQAVSGYRHAEPTVHHWNADMLLARDAPGDRDKARELLAAAAEGYARLGMAGFERRARQRLETGAGSPPSPTRRAVGR
jgi:hypothetical protein